MLAITITRQESYDPLFVIEQATRQAIAQALAADYALDFHYEKDSTFQGDCVYLVISATDAPSIAPVLERLKSLGYSGPHRRVAGRRRPAASDRTPLRGVRRPGVHSPRQRGFRSTSATTSRSCETANHKKGLYKTLLPEGFPDKGTIVLGELDWTVSVIHR